MYERRQTVLVQRREDPEFRPTGFDEFLTADVTRATKQRSETAGLFSVMAEGLEYANTPFRGLFDRFGVAVNVEKTARFAAIEPQFWTTEDLVEWLESLRYGIDIVNEFRQQQYDGTSLKTMSASNDFCLDVLTTGFRFPQTVSRFELAQHISNLFLEQQTGTTGGVSNSPPIYSQFCSFATIDAALWTTNQLVEWLESLQYGFAVTNAFKTFSNLVNDRDEFTQEVASKVGLVYELGVATIKASLFNSLSYQGILSPASDLNQPDLEDGWGLGGGRCAVDSWDYSA
ncbi:hypothetical protein HDU98_009136 [Podochytrium sp. JEL0797]|nr:hypothetical protein HDU98_009136 [Podochytrium sp. JEL0797]